MGHFDRSGNRGSGHDRDRSGRDNNRPQMHRATCNACGNNCEVPFKPTGSKPIYCSNCFEKKGNNGAPRRDRRDTHRNNFREERKMYKTECAECGTSCEVPFEPRAGRPVFCDSCFTKQNNRGRGGEEVAELKQKIDALHAKVDILMNILDPKKLEKKAVAKKTPIKKVTKKNSTKKTVKKSTRKKITKKAPTKKTTKKTKTKKIPAKKVVKKVVKKTIKK